MANNILKSISDIFDRKLFRIPDYQRGYSWEDKHLKAFWDDLERLPENKNHYTGLITLESITDWKERGSWKNDEWLIEKQKFTPFHIVDGQQRVTTIIIVINAILSKLKEDDSFVLDTKTDISRKYIKLETNGLKSYVFGYEENDPSNNYFKACILSDGQGFNQPMDIYTRNLENAQKFFTKKLEDSKLGELETLYNKLTLRLLFNLYEIEDEIDVYVTFETTNNRGKPLSKLELLKNRLIYLTTQLKNNNSPHFNNEIDDLRISINKNWKIVYEYLGKNIDNKLDDDDFLKNHVFMYFGHKNDTESQYSDFLLDDYFTAQNASDGNLSIKDIKEYVESIGKSVKEWFKIKNPEYAYTLENFNMSKDISEWLSKLNRLEFAAFSPSIMAILQKNYNPENILETLKYMERYIFLVLKVTSRKSNAGKNFFYTKANEIWKDKVTLPEFQSHILSRITAGHDFSLKEFHDKIVKLFEEKKGFYDWPSIKYFLFEYELSLELKSGEDSKVTWKSFNRDNTIEHIYPQQPKEEYWTQRFSKLTDIEKGLLENNLGNLLLLKGKKNIVLSNRNFDFKRDKYTEGSYSQIEVSKYKEWTPKEILERSLKMLEFLEERWNAPINDQHFRKKVLCLPVIK